MTALELASKLREQFPDVISAPLEFRGEITVQVVDAQKIHEVCAFAKKQCQYLWGIY